ncbi:hypothetical protein BV210_10085 [Halorientalis sp. IM1011]|uniref:hypothetical protein n=1 Tax=Halorientalis sp. IM1011 TaxID=1932360 RepID=UPI00097CCE4E|nr:hypothetical protein [Halorientalis sp. IM1011]AQL43044.1 hypothetical protein BV210_10085 [Halorientalis sp. IM1011]
MSNDDPFRLALQVPVAGTALLVAAAGGLLGGSLAPLVRIEGLEAMIVPLMLTFYVMTGFLFTFGAMAASQISGETTEERGRDVADSETEWGRVATALAGTAVGSAVGGRLVFGVPDWLSTTLPLVALFAAAVAFVLAGDAVPIRGLDTALRSAGGTIYLFVVPAALYPVFDLAGLMIAAVVGAASFLVARRWVRGGMPIDRRISVAVALVFALVAGGVMAHDLSGPQPTVELHTDPTVNLSTPEERFYSWSDTGQNRSMVRVGTVTARNEFDFGRTAALPAYAACLYGPNGTRPAPDRVAAPVVETDGWVSAVEEVRLVDDGSRRFSVVVFLDGFDERSNDEIRNWGTVPVRRANSCPETTDGPALVLVPADEN